MSKVIISQDLKSKRLTNYEKDKLHRLLLNNSGLKEEKDNIMKSISSFLETIIIEDILDPEYYELFKKSSRIRKKENNIRIDGGDVLIILDGENKPNYFPNSKIGVPKYDKKVHSTIRMYHCFQLTIEVPTYLRDFNTWKDKIPENKLDILRDLLIELYTTEFYISNYLTEYCSKSWGRQFLPYVNTWGQLYKDHYDWFDVLFKEEGKDLSRKELGMTEEDDIKNTLLDLKTLLNS